MYLLYSPVSNKKIAIFYKTALHFRNFLHAPFGVY